MEQEATRQKAEMEQEAIRRKAQMKQEAARVNREKAELKAKSDLLEARREAAAAEAEARVLEYDDRQALDDLPKETEDPLQRVQDFVNKHPVPTAVQEVTGPLKKKQTPIKLSHEAPDFVPSVALNLPSQTPPALPTDTKSPEVTLFPDLGAVKEDNETGGYYAFSVGSQLPKDAIEVKNFYGYVEKRRGKEGDILKEFLNLKSGLQKPTDAALKPGNRLKNKYKDMYAYDETRVILDNSSYINASFIQGYGQVRKYIAAQGPLDKTVDDFWRMVWEYDCGKIVMLTNVFENGKEKETKTVFQFHFTAWPDKDVPKYASSLVHFRHKVNTTRTVAKGPMVVHCSAGVGRTGTYIALDYIVHEAKERDYVEVFRSVEILRNQRVNMVQTAHQYLFLHEAVLEALMCPNSGIPCRDFSDNYKDLMRFDNNKKKHKLQVEYELMNSISSRHDEEAFIGSEMPLLSTAVDGRNEYINAVFLPGYRNNQTFIVTQMPLETTVVDLWRLIYDYEIPTIVMLNKDIQTGVRQVKLFKAKFWEENMIVPGSANDMLSFLSGIEDEHSNNRGCGPVLVHCLNGCDKSGLYCVLATVIERLRIEQDVDIQHIIKQMRNRRPQIIPNYEQFQFIYEAVIEYLKEFETYSNFQ
ncbi:receptor-type tyrosine-protein phosphatase kappa-like [Mytilus californianus]|uniref:receptor-type tyrosine-protein phosphatase kappa-like n=1 Tax=Mytilus californianus TaxID=6549 RepID=UPI0022485650|nr:receptor-type tyrosine-protein phosphatase kappa-like [Mytilus californianus]